MIFFYRWLKDYQRITCEDVPSMFIALPPQNMNRQPPYKIDKVRNMVKENLYEVISQEYIEASDVKFVKSLMYMFHVPNGDAEIRMVYGVQWYQIWVERRPVCSLVHVSNN